MTGSYSYAILHNFFLSASTAPTFVASFTMDADSGAAPLAVAFTDTSIGSPTGWLWNFGDGVTSTAQNPTHTYSEAGTYTVTLTATNAAGSDDATDTVFVTPGIGAPGGSLYRPLRLDDANTNFFDGIFSVASDYVAALNPAPNPYDHTVIATSDEPGANVYAAANGTVQSIELLNALSFECPGMDSSFNCYFGINSGPIGRAVDVNPAELYRVEVSYGMNEHLNYYVAAAQNYVYEGAEINAGCIIGKTAPLVETIATVAGAAFIERIDNDTGDQASLITSLVIEPQESKACNIDPAFADCMPFDSEFITPDQWLIPHPNKVRFANGNVEIDPGGVLKYSGIPLNPSTAYRFSVEAETLAPYGDISGSRLQLSIGTTSVSHFVNFYPGVKSVELAMHTPDEGSLYSVQIANVGTRHTIQVNWNCISENTDTTPASQCYFANYSFDSYSGDWAKYGTVIVPPSNGEWMADDEGAIGQNVYLYPNTGGAHDYTVTLDWAWYVTGGDPTADAPTVQFEYRFNSDPYQNFGSLNTYRALDYSFSETTRQVISVTDAISGEFRLQVNIDPKTFSGNLKILLREICIHDDFTHHPEGGGVVPGGVGSDMCTTVPRPDISSSSNVGAWVNYLWLNLRNFFYCNLEPLLEKIAAIANDTLQLVRWQILYWQASGARLMAWSGNSLIPWLGGHFANMAFGRQNTVIQEAEGCNNLFCLLQSLVEEILAPVVDLIVNFLTQVIDLLYKLINMALDLLGTLASAIVRLIAEVINLITTLVQFVRMYLFAFISAITNAQPVPMDGLPNCSDDPQSTSWCMAFYGLDKTVFAAEGQLIIPVFIGVLAVMQLIWLAQKISELIERIGGGL